MLKSGTDNKDRNKFDGDNFYKYYEEWDFVYAEEKKTMNKKNKSYG